MDLRHARTFVTVAELGTVSKAAVRLHTSQPALSRQVSNLEQELGLKLFDRVGRRLVLSSDGEQLLGDFRNRARVAYDKTGKLRYMGPFQGDGAGFARDAVTQVLAGQEVSMKTRPLKGCPIPKP